MGRLKTLPFRLAVAPASRLAAAARERRADDAREHRGASWQAIRRRVLARDCGMCVVCRNLERFTLAQEVDHVVPVWRGGTDDDANLQSICRPCHKAKSAAEASERSRT